MFVPSIFVLKANCRSATCIPRRHNSTMILPRREHDAHHYLMIAHFGFGPLSLDNLKT